MFGTPSHLQYCMHSNVNPILGPYAEHVRPYSDLPATYLQSHAILECLGSVVRAPADQTSP